MHVCQITDILSDDERSYLGEVVETALEEAREVLSVHEGEPPLLFETQTISEAAQDYTNLVTTAKQRVSALERVKTLLEGR